MARGGEGTIIRGRRLIEGLLLFEEIRYIPEKECHHKVEVEVTIFFFTVQCCMPNHLT